MMTETGVASSYGPAFEPSRRESIIDPYPALRHFRETQPVHVVPELGGRAFFRYDDCDRIFRDPRFSRDPLKTPEYAKFIDQNPDKAEHVASVLRRRFFEDMDPPDQTRLRRLVSSALSKTNIALLRSESLRYFERALDAVLATGEREVDLHAFSSNPPAQLLASWAGLPVNDHADFVRWARDSARAYDPTNPASMHEAIRPLHRYVEELVADRRSNLRDDLLSDLIRAEDNGEHLTFDELVGIVSVLVVGASETSSSAINNAVLALMRNRDQWDALKTDPSLIAALPHEALRYDAVIMIQWRMALEEVEIADVAVEPGETVFLMMGSANRDEARFRKAERFDLRRENSRDHLGFATGIHKCAGLHMARLEMETAVEVLLRRLPDLQLAGDPEYLMSPAVHLIEKLPVRITR